MKVFTCTDFEGHWPVGAAAVVVAPDEETARSLFSAVLIANGLKGYDARDPFTLNELNISEPSAHILFNGEY